MSEWVLEIKEGSYADHEYVCDEWHRIELNLNEAKMKPLVRCRDCKYFKQSFWACENECLVKANGSVLISVDPDGFCSHGKFKEQK